MDFDAPVPDPFAGMTQEERKRAHETAILEMVYSVSRFHSVTPNERPDFELVHRVNMKPFGVEITQLFVNESIARFNLIPGYPHRLWSGGAHLHKKDVKVLQSVRVKVSDQDGNIRHPDLPAVITETPSLDAFRAQLGKVIRGKSEKGYDSATYSHINLVILDWFGLEFDASQYLTDRFFDDDVRAALKESPFREVLLIVNNTVLEGIGDDETRANDARIIPLQQLLAMERFYVTGHMIDAACDGQLSAVSELNRLTIDHVSRVQGYGLPVECEGRPFLLYSGNLLEIGEQGMSVRDSADYEVDKYPVINIADRMSPIVEARVTEEATANVFGCGFAEKAHRPSIWAKS